MGLIILKTQKIDGAVAASNDDKLKSSKYDRAYRTPDPEYPSAFEI